MYIGDIFEYASTINRKHEFVTIKVIGLNVNVYPVCISYGSWLVVFYLLRKIILSTKAMRLYVTIGFVIFVHLKRNYQKCYTLHAIYDNRSGHCDKVIVLHDIL